MSFELIYEQKENISKDFLHVILFSQKMSSSFFETKTLSNRDKLIEG